MSWSAAQYRRFEDDRTRPVRDLVAAIPTADPARAIDLGCGPGNSTEVLAARFPQAAITGIDSSADMIEAARARLPDIGFELANIESWRGKAPQDVILSNAVLQWLPDHERLLPRLVRQLAAGGSLAVQMPDNLEEPAYRIMRSLAGASAWREKLARAGTRGGMGTPDWYYRLLRPLCHRVDMWRTTYFHVLEGTEAIVAWFQGSGLRPYLAALDDAEREAFLSLFHDEIARAYPTMADGTALLPFPRLFLVATR